MHQFSVDHDLFIEKVITIILILDPHTYSILGLGHNFVLHPIS